MSKLESDRRESHGDYVQDADEFGAERAQWRADLAADDGLRAEAVALQVRGEQHRYTYTWDWLGVPVIRLPDDIVALQELIWAYRPQRVIEAGVARGGSMLLDASLMLLAGEKPAVLGIDLQIFPHTRRALQDHRFGEGVQLVEASSTSDEAREAVSDFIGSAERAVLILDSDHSHDHVLGELRSLAPLIPVGGFVLVADTLIEEFPPGHFEGRPWDVGSNPMTAVREFLAETPTFSLARNWSRRGLMSEFRDGILQRDS